MSITETGPRPQPSKRFRPAALLLQAVSKVAPDIKPRLQKVLIRSGYQFISRRNGMMSGHAFMNYGYAPLDDLGGTTGSPAAGAEHLSADLYTKVAGAVDLSGRDLLEVGCGRGGGAAHVARTLRPRSVTGVDFASRAIRECRRSFADSGLRFVIGDAENLPFPRESFDAVLNVESSHCYPDFGRFVQEVHRVLRPQGVFLFADLRLSRADHEMRAQFDAAGLTIVEEERITPNVLRALELDNERRLAVVRRSVPRPLQRAAMDFAGGEGSEVRTALSTGVLEYRRFVLRRT